MENKYINRYLSFNRSLDILSNSCGADPKAMFVLGATAQAFNLTFDLSWKVMKDVLVKYHFIQDFATGSPRETLRTAYSVGIISDDRWMNMLQVRNVLAHDYDGIIALKNFDLITNEFYQLFVNLKDKLEKYYSDEECENWM